MNPEILQKNLFDNLITEYEKHYDDKYSRIYRNRFIYKYLFSGIDLRSKEVLEAMCGSGQTTEFLLAGGARVTCLDVSEKALSNLRTRFKKVKIINSSMTGTELKNNNYDCVVIVGGLHHVHPNVNSAINEIYRILKVGGYLCFFEPHKGSFFDYFRRLWYKQDKFFASNEKSIDIKELKKKYKDKFNYLSEYYSGNLAYLFVYNSLIIRAPIWLKKIYSPILLRLESVIKIIQIKNNSCFVICQWRKK